MHPAGSGRRLVGSAISGIVWGCIVTVIAFDTAPRAIWGGLIASPAIGCVIGTTTRRWDGLPAPLRSAIALGSLYLAAALFGLGVGLYDWLVLATPNRIASGVVLQAVLAFLWGLTFPGWVVLFWPLAYLNHRLLARLDPTSGLVEN